jgi:hypothetical protein
VINPLALRQGREGAEHNHPALASGTECIARPRSPLSGLPTIAGVAFKVFRQGKRWDNLRRAGCFRKPNRNRKLMRATPGEKWQTRGHVSRKSRMTGTFWSQEAAARRVIAPILLGESQSGLQARKS